MRGELLGASLKFCCFAWLAAVGDSLHSMSVC